MTILSNLDRFGFIMLFVLQNFQVRLINELLVKNVVEEFVHLIMVEIWFQYMRISLMSMSFFVLFINRGIQTIRAYVIDICCSAILVLCRLLKWWVFVWWYFWTRFKGGGHVKHLLKYFTREICALLTAMAILGSNKSLPSTEQLG